MCETSELGEKLFTRNEILPISLEIGRRIMEIFGYHRISNIVFRLKSTSAEINAVINGQSLPSTELLLGIQKVTNASIDWILTGKGAKFIPATQVTDRSYEIIATTLLPMPTKRESTISLTRRTYE